MGGKLGQCEGQRELVRDLYGVEEEDWDGRDARNGEGEGRCMFE